MPIYEYACAECGHHLEVSQRIADDPLVTCPACGKDQLERLVSQSSFALKGSGWYADGYGGKKKDTPAASKPDKAAESKPEKKPDKKPETKSSD